MTKTRTVRIGNSQFNRVNYLNHMLSDPVKNGEIVKLSITSDALETDLEYMLRLRSLIADTQCAGSTKYDLMEELYELDYRGEK